MFKIKAPDGNNTLCGKRIAEIRKTQKISQRKLAIKMQLLGYDVDHYFIRRVENGERFLTDIELKIFSQTLHVPIADFFPVNNKKGTPR